MDDIEDMDQKELREWLRSGLGKKDRKRTRTELAKKLGLERTAVSKILSGNRAIKGHEIKKIAEYINENPPFGVELPIAEPISSDSIATYLSDVAVGVWRDMSIQALDQEEEIKNWPAGRYSDFKQHYLRVADDSCNLFAKKGEYIWAVEYGEARSALQHHDFVVVEKIQYFGEKYLSEWTVRKVIRIGGGFVLRGLSSHPNLSPDIKFDSKSTELRITHLVIARAQYLDY